MQQGISMINVIASNINPKTIQSIRTSSNHVMTRSAIYTCARVAQLVFASGCFFAAMQIPYRLAQILLGGFIFIQGPQMVLQAIPIIAYYDLAKISSNIASIFKSTVIVQGAKDLAGNNPYGKQAVQVLEDCEKTFSLPDSVVKNLNSSESIAKAITYETIVASNFNGIIAQGLGQ